MSAKATMLFVLFSCFGFIAKAEIPGGIVYSDNKDAIYYDFKTKETKNLTSDLNGAKVEGPFAVSDNGKFLIWVQNSKFFVRELPLGTPYAVKVNRAVWKGTKNRMYSKGENDIIEDITWIGNEIKNMTMSPDGSRFAFDTIFQEPGWVFQGKSVYGESGSYKGVYPFYDKRIDSYNGIFYLSTIYNKDRIDLPRNNPGAMGSNTTISTVQLFRPRYGNIVEYPPEIFTTSLKDMPLSPSASPPSRIVGKGGNYYIRVGGFVQPPSSNSKMVSYKTGIKKSAHFLTFQNMENWEKQRKLAAFIFQIGNQWGPIELRVLDSKKQDERDEIRQGGKRYQTKLEKLPENIKKCREWEIIISCESCEGLFWKPDGSLTIQNNGDLYSINTSQIQNGINRSGIKVTKKRGEINILPVNNVFTAQPQLVASGINSTCIFWVSNEAFLFLDKDKTVYLWDQGKKQKVLSSSISSEFYYCIKSPFEGIKDNIAPAITAIDNNSNELPATRGVYKTSEGYPVFRNTPNWSQDSIISFGPIQTIWLYRQKEDSVCIMIKNPHKKNGKTLQFAIVEDENDLDNIKDPSQYGYLSAQERMVSMIDDKRALKRSINGSKENLRDKIYEKIVIDDTNVTAYLNEIVILKSGTTYVAIKPISLELKYNSVEELPEWNQKLIKNGKDPDLLNLMTYEWKFWPSAPESTVKAEMKSLQETVVSRAKKQGWNIGTTPISKEFYIGDTKFLLELPKRSYKPEEEKPKFGFYFSLENFSDADKDGYIGYSFGNGKHYLNSGDVTNPSKIDFREMFSNNGSTHRSRMRYNLGSGLLILKIGNKYIAIKVLEEKDGWIQYKWKLWPGDLSSLATTKTKTREWEVLTTPVLKEFEINGVVFSWHPKNKDMGIGFLLTGQPKDKNTKIKFAIVYGEVEDLSYGDFKERIGVYCSWGDTGNPGPRGRSIYVVKTDNSYVAISPLEEKDGWVQYKWKSWPEAPSRDVVADASLTVLK